MGRDIQAIKISGGDRRMYRDKVRRSLDVFARMLRERMFEEDPSLIGQEIELNEDGSRLVMIGILPTLSNHDLHPGTMSANDRYRVLNEQIFAARARTCASGSTAPSRS